MLEQMRTIGISGMCKVFLYSFASIACLYALCTHSKQAPVCAIVGARLSQVGLRTSDLICGIGPVIWLMHAKALYGPY